LPGTEPGLRDAHVFALAYRRQRASSAEFEHVRRLEPRASRDLARSQPAVLRHGRRGRDGVCEPKPQERLDPRDLAEEFRNRLAGKVGQVARVELLEMHLEFGHWR
jgi:hypothetical protein